MVCAAFLTGCSGPLISVTDAAPRRVGFLVRNAWLVPMQEVDDRAASYCRQHGSSYRRVDSSWIAPTLKQVAYECDLADRPQPRKQTVRRAAAKPVADDPKAAAWIKAKAATDLWALCLRFDAERKASETTETPRSVAQEVVDACSGLEHAVHEPLEAAGEASRGFQADLHAQAVQNASDAVASARIRTGMSVSGPPAF